MDVMQGHYPELPDVAKEKLHKTMYWLVAEYDMTYYEWLGILSEYVTELKGCPNA